MDEVRIQTFGELKIYINEKELLFSEKTKEFTALIVAACGERVTARIAWAALKKHYGYRYNAVYFNNYIKKLAGELGEDDFGKLIKTEARPVRSCRIDISAVSCDYYQMLNGEISRKEKELFLPGYAWAQELYSTDLGQHYSRWYEKFEYMKENRR